MLDRSLLERGTSMLKSTWLKDALLMLGCVGVIGFSTSPTALASPSVYPTGVTVNDPKLAYDTPICFSGPDNKTHIIDPSGRELHHWNFVGLPGQIIDPALVGGERGHVLLQTSRFSDDRGGILGDKTVGEVDWEGRILWSWGDKAPGGGARQNHDWARLANGNTLLLVALPHVVSSVSDKPINDQAIYEVSKSGLIVWKWVAGDHLSEFGVSKAGMAYLRAAAAEGNADSWGYLEINDMQRLGPNRWFDRGDKRFDPDNIMLDSRKGNFVIIISKQTGRVVWRLGPDFVTRPNDQDKRISLSQIPRPVDQISGQHDAHLIPRGLPGAGNLLLFDDQGAGGFPRVGLGVYSGSRVLEIDPEKKQIVWQYTAIDSGLPPWSFFSSFVSSAQRLPNGNTLIDEGMTGRIFQITAAGKIVWEFVSPFLGTISIGGHPVSSAIIYRAQAVPVAWLPASAPGSDRKVPASQR